MDARIDAARAMSEELRQVALEELIGHDRVAARTRQAEWQPALIIRNRATRPRSGVALVEISVKLADVPVGPGSATRAPRTRTPETPLANVDVSHERTESPRAYPDNDAVMRFHTAVWVEDVPAYGVTAMSLADEPALTRTAPQPVSTTRRSMTNGRLTVAWDAKGRVSLEDHLLHRRVPDLLGWESRVDRGDLYTPSIGGPHLRPKLLKTRILANGPLTAVLEQQWRLSNASARVDARVRIVLDAASTFVRFGVLGTNDATDHRLRLIVNTGVKQRQVYADAAFGPVERRVIRPTPNERKMETPPGTDPMHRYVSLFDGRQGASVFSDGTCEYEATNGRVFLTLIRAVGELSRNDLPERPGHAGWPAATPEAQCLGPFEAEFGLLLHGARTPEVIDEIERTADDVLFPLTGETLRSAMSPASSPGIELAGRGLGLSCIKQSDDEAWTVLRCVNLLDSEADGVWRIAGGLREATTARLDETPLAPIAVRGGDVQFRVPPRGIMTILVR